MKSISIEYIHCYEGLVFEVKGMYIPGDCGSRVQPPSSPTIEFECEDLERIVRKAWSYYDFCDFVSNPAEDTYAQAVQREADDLEDAICTEIECRVVKQYIARQEEKAEDEANSRKYDHGN